MTDEVRLEADRSEVVDEFVDTLNVVSIEDEAERLELKPLDLLDRIVNEARARLTGGPA